MVSDKEIYKLIGTVAKNSGLNVVKYTAGFGFINKPWLKQSEQGMKVQYAAQYVKKLEGLSRVVRGIPKPSHYPDPISVFGAEAVKEELDFLRSDDADYVREKLGEQLYGEQMGKIASLLHDADLIGLEELLHEFNINAHDLLERYLNVSNVAREEYEAKLEDPSLNQTMEYFKSVRSDMSIGERINNMLDLHNFEHHMGASTAETMIVLLYMLNAGVYLATPLKDGSDQVIPKSEHPSTAEWIKGNTITYAYGMAASPFLDNLLAYIQIKRAARPYNFMALGSAQTEGAKAGTGNPAPWAALTAGTPITVIDSLRNYVDGLPSTLVTYTNCLMMDAAFDLSGKLNKMELGEIDGVQEVKHAFYNAVDPTYS